MEGDSYYKGMEVRERPRIFDARQYEKKWRDLDEKGRTIYGKPYPSRDSYKKAPEPERIHERDYRRDEDREPHPYPHSQRRPSSRSTKEQSSRGSPERSAEEDKAQGEASSVNSEQPTPKVEEVDEDFSASAHAKEEEVDREASKSPEVGSLEELMPRGGADPLDAMAERSAKTRNVLANVPILPHFAGTDLVDVVESITGIPVQSTHRKRSLHPRLNRESRVTYQNFNEQTAFCLGCISGPCLRTFSLSTKDRLDDYLCAACAKRKNVEGWRSHLEGLGFRLDSGNQTSLADDFQILSNMYWGASADERPPSPSQIEPDAIMSTESSL